MQLYRNYDGSPTGENLLPDFFFSQSSSMSVNNSFMTVQDNFGQVLTSPKGTLSARTFSITGNVDAERCTNVEELRASLFNKMYGKVLWLKVQDDDKRIFKVILDGNVNVTYNIGYEISRVFTLSFTLKAFEGVSWGNEVITLKCFRSIITKQPYFSYPFTYEGDVPIMPYISLSFVYRTAYEEVSESESIPFKIKSTTELNGATIIRNKNRRLKLMEKVHINEPRHFFFIKNGLAYTGTHSTNGELFKDVHPNSLACPLLLYPGHNHIFIRKVAIELPQDVLNMIERNSPQKYSYYILITIKYRPCFF